MRSEKRPPERATSALMLSAGCLVSLLSLFVVAEGIPAPTGQIPADWVQRVNQGYMLYNQSEPTREDIKPQGTQFCFFARKQLPFGIHARNLTSSKLSS